MRLFAVTWTCDAEFESVALHPHASTSGARRAVRRRAARPAPRWPADHRRRLVEDDVVGEVSRGDRAGQEAHVDVFGSRSGPEESSFHVDRPSAAGTSAGSRKPPSFENSIDVVRRGRSRVTVTFGVRVYCAPLLIVTPSCGAVPSAELTRSSLSVVAVGAGRRR